MQIGHPENESHRSRNVRPTNHFQTIVSNAAVKKQREAFFWFVLKTENLIILFLYSPKAYSLAMLNPAVLSVPNPNYPTVLETWYSWGGRGKKFNWRQWTEAALEGFLSWGRNSWPDCFGVVSVEPRLVCKPSEYWHWWGAESGFQTGSCKNTFNHLVWAWLQKGRGALHQTGLGSEPVPTNRIIKTLTYLWAINRFTAAVHFIFSRFDSWLISEVFFRPACISAYFIWW